MTGAGSLSSRRSLHDEAVIARLARFASEFQEAGLDPVLLDSRELLRLVVRAAAGDPVEAEVQVSAADAVDGLRLLDGERTRLGRDEIVLIEAALDNGETWESLGQKRGRSKQAEQQYYRRLGGRRRWRGGRPASSGTPSPASPQTTSKPTSTGLATEFSTVIDAACGPDTGMTHRALEDAARVHQDHLAADTLHGPTPGWADLTSEQRQDLVDQRAVEFRAAFDAPAPTDPVPIDHSSPTSPPYPRGVDEVRLWHAWIARELKSSAAMAEGQGDRAPGYLLGRVVELRHWLDKFDDAAYLARARHTARPPRGGSVELAEWIVWAERRVALLAEQYERSEADRDKGHLTEATFWLGRLRRRQQARAKPDQWDRGGRGLLAALRAAGRLPDTLNHDVVVIAAHDADRDRGAILRGPRRDLLAVLRDWTGQPEEWCAEAIRQAFTLGLVDGHTEAEVWVTHPKGWRRYQHLLTAVTPGSWNAPPILE